MGKRGVEMDVKRRGGEDKRDLLSVEKCRLAWAAFAFVMLSRIG